MDATLRPKFMRSSGEKNASNHISPVENILGGPITSLNRQNSFNSPRESSNDGVFSTHVHTQPNSGNISSSLPSSHSSSLPSASPRPSLPHGPAEMASTPQHSRFSLYSPPLLSLTPSSLSNESFTQPQMKRFPISLCGINVSKTVSNPPALPQVHLTLMVPELTSDSHRTADGKPSTRTKLGRDYSSHRKDQALLQHNQATISYNQPPTSSEAYPSTSSPSTASSASSSDPPASSPSLPPTHPLHLPLPVPPYCSVSLDSATTLHTLALTQHWPPNQPLPSPLPLSAPFPSAGSLISLSLYPHVWPTGSAVIYSAPSHALPHIFTVAPIHLHQSTSRLTCAPLPLLSTLSNPALKQQLTHTPDTHAHSHVLLVDGYCGLTLISPVAYEATVRNRLDEVASARAAMHIALLHRQAASTTSTGITSGGNLYKNAFSPSRSPSASPPLSRSSSTSSTSSFSGVLSSTGIQYTDKRQYTNYSTALHSPLASYPEEEEGGSRNTFPEKKNRNLEFSGQTFRTEEEMKQRDDAADSILDIASAPIPMGKNSTFSGKDEIPGSPTDSLSSLPPSSLSRSRTLPSFELCFADLLTAYAALFTLCLDLGVAIFPSDSMHTIGTSRVSVAPQLSLQVQASALPPVVLPLSRVHQQGSGNACMCALGCVCVRVCRCVNGCTCPATTTTLTNATTSMTNKTTILTSSSSSHDPKHSVSTSTCRCHAACTCDILCKCAQSCQCWEKCLLISIDSHGRISPFLPSSVLLDVSLPFSLSSDQFIRAWQHLQPDITVKAHTLGRTPRWLPDDASERCLSCHRGFGLLARKHHCRACGTLACRQCCDKTAVLPDLGYTEPVRVCRQCFHIICKYRVSGHRGSGMGTSTPTLSTSITNLPTNTANMSTSTVQSNMLRGTSTTSSSSSFSSLPPLPSTLSPAPHLTANANTNNNTTNNTGTHITTNTTPKTTTAASATLTLTSTDATITASTNSSNDTEHTHHIAAHTPSPHTSASSVYQHAPRRSRSRSPTALHHATAPAHGADSQTTDDMTTTINTRNKGTATSSSGLLLPQLSSSNTHMTNDDDIANLSGDAENSEDTRITAHNGRVNSQSATNTSDSAHKHNGMVGRGLERGQWPEQGGSGGCAGDGVGLVAECQRTLMATLQSEAMHEQSQHADVGLTHTPAQTQTPMQTHVRTDHATEHVPGTQTMDAHPRPTGLRDNNMNTSLTRQTSTHSAFLSPMRTKTQETTKLSLCRSSSTSASASSSAFTSDLDAALIASEQHRNALNELAFQTPPKFPEFRNTKSGKYDRRSGKFENSGNYVPETASAPRAIAGEPVLPLSLNFPTSPVSPISPDHVSHTHTSLGTIAGSVAGINGDDDGGNGGGSVSSPSVSTHTLVVASNTNTKTPAAHQNAHTPSAATTNTNAVATANTAAGAGAAGANGDVDAGGRSMSRVHSTDGDLADGHMSHSSKNDTHSKISDTNSKHSDGPSSNRRSSTSTALRASLSSTSTSTSSVSSAAIPSLSTTPSTSLMGSTPPLLSLTPTGEWFLIPCVPAEHYCDPYGFEHVLPPTLQQSAGRALYRRVGALVQYANSVNEKYLQGVSQDCIPPAVLLAEIQKAEALCDAHARHQALALEQQGEQAHVQRWQRFLCLQPTFDRKNSALLSLIRTGIPYNLRGEIWILLLESNFLKEYYDRQVPVKSGIYPEISDSQGDAFPPNVTPKDVILRWKGYDALKSHQSTVHVADNMLNTTATTSTSTSLPLASSFPSPITDEAITADPLYSLACKLAAITTCNSTPSSHYSHLLSRAVAAFDYTTMVEIEKDVNRTLGNNSLFKEGSEGISALRRILVAYAMHNPEIGYCQSMNFLCAVFLCVLRSEESAFWALTCLVEGILQVTIKMDAGIGVTTSTSNVSSAAREHSIHTHHADHFSAQSSSSSSRHGSIDGTYLSGTLPSTTHASPHSAHRHSVDSRSSNPQHASRHSSIDSTSTSTSTSTASSVSTATATTSRQPSISDSTHAFTTNTSRHPSVDSQYAHSNTSRHPSVDSQPAYMSSRHPSIDANTPSSATGSRHNSIEGRGGAGGASEHHVSVDGSIGESDYSAGGGVGADSYSSDTAGADDHSRERVGVHADDRSNGYPISSGSGSASTLAPFSRNDSYICVDTQDLPSTTSLSPTHHHTHAPAPAPAPVPTSPPRIYYHQRDLLGSRVDCHVIQTLVHARLPRLSSVLDHHGLNIAELCIPWLLPLYMDVLSVKTLLNVWDCLLYEGAILLIRVAIALFKIREQRICSAKDVGEIMTLLDMSTVTWKQLSHVLYTYPVCKLSNVVLVEHRAKVYAELMPKPMPVRAGKLPQTPTHNSHAQTHNTQAAVQAQMRRSDGVPHTANTSSTNNHNNGSSGSSVDGTKTRTGHDSSKQAQPYATKNATHIPTASAISANTSTSAAKVYTHAQTPAAAPMSQAQALAVAAAMAEAGLYQVPAASTTPSSSTNTNANSATTIASAPLSIDANSAAAVSSSTSSVMVTSGFPGTCATTTATASATVDNGGGITAHPELGPSTTFTNSMACTHTSGNASSEALALSHALSLYMDTDAHMPYYAALENDGYETHARDAATDGDALSRSARTDNSADVGAAAGGITVSGTHSGANAIDRSVSATSSSTHTLSGLPADGSDGTRNAYAIHITPDDRNHDRIREKDEFRNRNSGNTTFLSPVNPGSIGSSGNTTTPNVSPDLRGGRVISACVVRTHRKSLIHRVGSDIANLDVSGKQDTLGELRGFSGSQENLAQFSENRSFSHSSPGNATNGLIMPSRISEKWIAGPSSLNSQTLSHNSDDSAGLARTIPKNIAQGLEQALLDAAESTPVGDNDGEKANSREISTFPVASFPVWNEDDGRDSMLSSTDIVASVSQLHEQGNIPAPAAMPIPTSASSLSCSSSVSSCASTVAPTPSHSVSAPAQQSQGSSRENTIFRDKHDSRENQGLRDAVSIPIRDLYVHASYTPTYTHSHAHTPSTHTTPLQQSLSGPYTGSMSGVPDRNSESTHIPDFTQDPVLSQNISSQPNQRTSPHPSHHTHTQTTTLARLAAVSSSGSLSHLSLTSPSLPLSAKHPPPHPFRPSHLAPSSPSSPSSPCSPASPSQPSHPSASSSAVHITAVTPHLPHVSSAGLADSRSVSDISQTPTRTASMASMEGSVPPETKVDGRNGAKTPDNSNYQPSSGHNTEDLNGRDVSSGTASELYVPATAIPIVRHGMRGGGNNAITGHENNTNGNDPEHRMTRTTSASSFSSSFSTSSYVSPSLLPSSSLLAAQASKNVLVSTGKSPSPFLGTRTITAAVSPLLSTQNGNPQFSQAQTLSLSSTSSTSSPLHGGNTITNNTSPVLRTKTLRQRNNEDMTYDATVMSKSDTRTSRTHTGDTRTTNTDVSNGNSQRSSSTSTLSSSSPLTLSETSERESNQEKNTVFPELSPEEEMLLRETCIPEGSPKLIDFNTVIFHDGHF